MTYIYISIVYIGGYVNKPGVAVVFGAEVRRQSETSVLGERLYLRNGVFKLYLLRHERLNELFVRRHFGAQLLFIHLNRQSNKYIYRSGAKLSKTRRQSCTETETGAANGGTRGVTSLRSASSS